MKFEITRFQSSLLTLAALKRNLEDALRPIKAIARNDLRDSLAAWILINVHSFNQEWKRFESFGKTDLNIRQTLKIASPLVRRVRSWKGIGKLRSKALAHEMFDADDQSLVDITSLFGHGKAPSEMWEQILLGECSVYAISIALTRHEAERASAVKIVYKDGPHMISHCGISTEEKFLKEMLDFKRAILDASPELKIMFALDDG